MSSPSRILAVTELPLPAASERHADLAPLFAVAEKLMDFGAVFGAVYVVNRLYQALEPERAVAYSASTVFFCAAGFALLFVFLLERSGAYRPSMSLLAIRETERFLRVSLQSFLLALLGAYLCGVRVSRLAAFLALATVPVFLTVEKWEMRNVLRILRSRGYGSRKALIFGTGATAKQIFSAMVRSPKFGIDPVAFVDDDPQGSITDIYESSYERRHSARVLHEPLCPELFHRLGASVLVIATSAMNRESKLLIAARASEAGVDTYFTTDELLGPGHPMDYEELDDIMLAHCSRNSNRWVYDCGKRTLDLLAAASLLVLLAPLCVVIAVLVKVSSPGPILFRQERVGLAGRLFTIYKFRTMYRDAPKYGYSPGAGDDPRVTPFGRFLRRSSLDELPQLFNVLLGQMSLVGPRPEMRFIVEQYTALQRQRLAVKPGITGLWQLSADRAFEIHENMEYDHYYVRHRSLLLDIAIVLHTARYAARGI